MKNILYCLVAIFIFNSSFSQGLKLSTKEELMSIEQFKLDDYGFATNLPSSYSLEKYIPRILNQKKTMSCVGYSAVYYGLSAMYNKTFEITDRQEKFAYSFDPMFIYSLLREDNYCSEGVIMKDAFELLTRQGAKKLFMPPEYVACDATWSTSSLSQMKNFTNPFRIKNYRSIDAVSTYFVDEVKTILNKDEPVIIAITLTDSFDEISSNGLWTPSRDEDSNGGHAMCVIGYDDNQFGGAFKIANSWGSDFGDNGYIWVTYSDFYYYVPEAYQMDIADNIDLNNNVQIREDNFIKITFDNNSSYEGEFTNGYYTGNAIEYDGDGAYFIGKFNKGLRNGSFIMIYNDDIFFPKYDLNGEYIEMEDYGFAGQEDELTVKKETFLNIIDPKMSIKKSKSHKSNKTTTIPRGYKDN